MSTTPKQPTPEAMSNARTWLVQPQDGSRDDRETPRLAQLFDRFAAQRAAEAVEQAYRVGKVAGSVIAKAEADAAATPLPGDAGERDFIERVIAICGDDTEKLRENLRSALNNGRYWRGRCERRSKERDEARSAASQAHIPPGDAVDLAMAEAERLGSRSFPGTGDTLMISIGRLRTIIAGAASQARRETLPSDWTLAWALMEARDVPDEARGDSDVQAAAIAEAQAILRALARK